MKIYDSFGDLNKLLNKKNTQLSEEIIENKPVLENDIFKNIITTNEDFDDEHIFKILDKTSNLNVKKLASYFLTLEKTSDKYKNYKSALNKLCKELLNIYGSKILTLIYNLPYVSNNVEISNLHSFNLNHKVDDVFFEGYKLKLDGETIYLNFHREMRYNNFNVKTYDRGYLRIAKKNSNNNFFSLLCSIEKDGEIDKSFFKNIKFSIYSIINENMEIELFSGSMDIRCKVCHRPLSTPESVFYGIGPECARNIS